MDELKIKSKFTTGIIAKIIKSLVRKKLGVDIDLFLSCVSAVMRENSLSVHVEADLDIPKENITKLTSSLF